MTSSQTETAPGPSAPASSPAATVQAFLDALARRDVAARSPSSARRRRSPSIRSGSGAAAPAAGRVLDDLVRAFPDLLVTTGRVITTGDVVTALIKVEGTQAADYAGAINQEKHLDIDQAWRFTVTGGLITGVSAYWCQRQLYRRLAVKRFDAIAIA